MLKHPELTEARILKVLPELQAAIHAPRQAAEAFAWHVDGEPISWEEAAKASYKPFAVGEPWGPMWSTTWFRVEGTVPREWEGSEVVLLMRLSDYGREGFSAEGLVFEEGKPKRALNMFRNEIEVSPKARGGERFAFQIEAGANFAHPGGKVIETGHKPLFTLAQLELACVNREVFDYYYDFKTAAEAMSALAPESQRRAELRHALNESLNLLDLQERASVGRARNALKSVLAKENGDTVHRISAIGHAHIDTAWLWPLRETIRKCARTFATALDYMEKYPEYVFGCSQAQQYAWMKEYYPSIYEGIKRRVKEGRWEPIGSMWVEPDCNLASGESLIRQILHGKRFFQEEFDYETKDAWIPDVFGYSASMPQIFRKTGIDYFLTQKISWNQFNKFPHHTFLWEGIDGTRVFTHFPPADTYNGKMSPKELLYNTKNFREHGRTDRSLYIYGYGDGGGGPTIEMLEQARRLKDFAELPRVDQEKALDFFKAAEADSEKLSVWVGELYLELHRGTYTTQAQTKKNNRLAEQLLREAEFWDAMSAVVVAGRNEQAACPARARHDTTGLGAANSQRHEAALRRAWNLVLLNQFHDIIPGSSIGWVYRDSASDYEVVQTLGNSVVQSALGAMDENIDTSGFARPVRVVNTLSFARSEIVRLPSGVLRALALPSCSYLVVEDTEVPDTVGSVRVIETADVITVENGLLSLKIGRDGLLAGLFDKETGREVLAKSGQGNLFQLHPDKPVAWDAWDIDAYYREQSQDLRRAKRIEVVENHPLKAKVEIEHEFGRSRIVQKVVVTHDSRRIDFETEVDWQEEHKLLKVAFPVAVRSARATYEIQFGHVERPTHYNTSWDLARFEVCAHRWADLSEASYGVALLNDCKYGYDIHGSVMRLSLLRSPTAPDPAADRGRHTFTYALFPHRGTLQEAKVIEEAYGLGSPLGVRGIAPKRGSQPAGRTFFEISRPGVILETVKIAENRRSLILRLYEAYGSRGSVELRTTLPVLHVAQTDLLEREEKKVDCHDGLICFEIQPFEIVTLSLEFGECWPC